MEFIQQNQFMSEITPRVRVTSLFTRKLLNALSPSSCSSDGDSFYLQELRSTIQLRVLSAVSWISPTYDIFSPPSSSE